MAWYNGEKKEEKLKVILTVIQVQDEYRAVIGIKSIPEVVSSKKVIYQDIQDAENTAHTRDVIREMKERATTWVREKGIDFVFNLDPDTCP